MYREPRESINSEHVFFAKRAIASYLNGLSQNKEPLNRQDVRKNTGPLFRTKENLLDLSHRSLNDAELIALLPEIATLNLVTILELRQNYITGKGIKALLEYLPDIENLGLSSCRLDLNQGCLYLAQFKRLRAVCVSTNNLQSADLDQLQASCSLTYVYFSDNPDLNIVSKARLYGALAYNSQALLPHAGTSMHTDPKDKKEEEAKKKEYIRTTFELHRRKVQEVEKLNADLGAMLRSPTPFSF